MKKMKNVVSLFLVMVLVAVNFSVIDVKANVELKNPVYDAEKDYAEWDCIYFGNFYQSDSEKLEPIKWRVLSVDGNKAMLLSDKNLVNSSFVNYYLAQSQARLPISGSWGASMAKQAVQKILDCFTEDENAALIEDKYISTVDKDGVIVEEEAPCFIRTLTLAEACNPEYGFCKDAEVPTRTRKAQTTEYALINDYGTVEDNWWLNEIGTSALNIRANNDNRYIMSVNSQGCINTIGSFFINDRIGKGTYYVVRPVVMLDLSKTDVWKYAGKVVTDDKDIPLASGIKDKQDSKVTPTPATDAKTDVKQDNKPAGNDKNSADLNTSEIKLSKAKIKSINKKGKKINIVIKKDNKATGYEVYRALKKNGKYTKIADITSNKMTIKVKKNKKYYYKVRLYAVREDNKYYGEYSAAKRK